MAAAVAKFQWLNGSALTQAQEDCRNHNHMLPFKHLSEHGST